MATPTLEFINDMFTTDHDLLFESVEDVEDFFEAYGTVLTIEGGRMFTLIFDGKKDEGNVDIVFKSRVKNDEPEYQIKRFTFFLQADINLWQYFNYPDEGIFVLNEMVRHYQERTIALHRFTDQQIDLHNWACYYPMDTSLGIGYRYYIRNLIDQKKFDEARTHVLYIRKKLIRQVTQWEFPPAADTLSSYLKLFAFLRDERVLSEDQIHKIWDALSACLSSRRALEPDWA